MKLKPHIVKLIIDYYGDIETARNAYREVRDAVLESNHGYIFLNLNGRITHLTCNWTMLDREEYSRVLPVIEK